MARYRRLREDVWRRELREILVVRGAEAALEAGAVAEERDVLEAVLVALRVELLGREPDGARERGCDTRRGGWVQNSVARRLGRVWGWRRGVVVVVVAHARRGAGSLYRGWRRRGRSCCTSAEWRPSCRRSRP